MYGWETRMLPRHCLDQVVSQPGLARRCGIDRTATWRRVRTGQLDRDLAALPDWRRRTCWRAAAQGAMPAEIRELPECAMHAGSRSFRELCHWSPKAGQASRSCRKQRLPAKRTSRLRKFDNGLQEEVDIPISNTPCFGASISARRTCLQRRAQRPVEDDARRHRRTPGSRQSGLSGASATASPGLSPADAALRS